MGSKLSALLVSATIVTGLLAAGPVASAAGKPAGKPAAAVKLPARFTRQVLHWKTCKKNSTYWQGVDCALLKVPLDYAKPGGRTIEVAIDRLRAAGGMPSLGILMTNPGGPGTTGLFMVPKLRQAAPPAVHQSYEIVGMNPRGFGPWQGMGAGATRLTCASIGRRKVTPPVLPGWASATLRFYADHARKQELACQDRAAGLRRYITTMNTARDIDLLRMVLGKARISYFGVSYGTWLGAVYGALFPSHLNRMVLDGALNPRISWYDSETDGDNAQLFNFSSWAAWAAANDLGLGASAADVRVAVDKLYGDLGTTEPIGGFTQQSLSRDIGTFTRYRKDWATFAARLRNAIMASDGEPADPAMSRDVASASDLVPGPTDVTPLSDEDSSDGVYNAVTCDWPWPKPNAAGYREYNDNINFWLKTFPYGNTLQPRGPSACTYLNYKPLEALPVITSRGAYPRGLVVNTDGDIQTPLATARVMAKTLGFDLITVTNDGTHAIAFSDDADTKPNRCVDDAVTAYLITGKLPGTITCPTANPPTTSTSTSLTAEARADAAQDIP
ncbi:MAG TPA: alpha/beta fold hydrolase [Streptosporangiaceae bacterium]|nr:alpha/beta fold hydrolase [Streptosporangiaceae bacterium]